MDFSQHLFRCSGWGHLMTDPKGKTNAEKYEEAKEKAAKLAFEYDGIENKKTKTAANKLEAFNKAAKIERELAPLAKQVELSESAKTHLIDVYVATKYNRHDDIETWAVKKGIDVEEKSLTIFSAYNKDYFVKNEQHLSNSWIKGTPDIRNKKNKEVIDIKSSWDAFTFFRNLGEDVKKLYYWQLQGYMWLDDADKARLVYCLVDTPEHILDSMVSYLRRTMPPSLVEEVIEMKKQQLIFNDIPYRERVIEQHILRNDADIEKGKQRVIQARKYLQKIDSEAAWRSLNTELK